MLVKRKCVIIGSGVAGLASAIRLAVQGFNVTVFEKNDHAGGKLYVFEKDGYRFDTGPSLFVQPSNIEELFRLAGEDIHQYLNYKPVDIACKYFYEDETVINAYINIEKFAKEIEQKTGEPSQHIIAYLNESKKIYNNIGNIFLNYSLHKKSTWLNIRVLKAISATRLSYIFSTLHAFNKRYFKNAHVVQLFDRYATYNGSNPFKAPAMLKLIPHAEFDEGVFYPNGGMIAINNALYKLALNKGVVFNFNAAVERIIVEDKKAKGVVVNNKNFWADVVISNADVYYTYRNLLGDAYKAKKILQQERSSSALVFYWRINKEFPQLQLHNIFFSINYKAEFNSIFKHKKPYNDPTVYINITSKHEPGVHAPSGKENWFVMVNVPAHTGISNAATIELYKKNIIAKLNRMLQTDIEPLIETETVLHPSLIEAETGSYAGAIYGTSSNSRKAAFLRHSNFSKHISSLYFVGGSVHPGGGIPLCLKSAKITSHIIKHECRK